MSVLLALCGVAGALPSWDFGDPAAAAAWTPNAHLADVAVRDGALHARAVDRDPFFTCRLEPFAATPWQYVLLRIKADRAGEGELFFTRALEGKYGGFSQDKSVRFKMRGEGAWEEIPIFPFWHREETIRQLRLDVYDDARFEIAWIRVLIWGDAPQGETDTYAWQFPDGDPGAWRIHPNALELFAPPMNLPLGPRGWVTVRMRAMKEAVGAVLWASPDAPGLHSESFAIRGDGQTRYYNVEVQSYASWGERLAAFGLRLPPDAGVQLESVAIADAPSGPGELVVQYFGFENGANRAGRPCSVLALLENEGGSAYVVEGAAMELPPGLALIQAPETLPTTVDFGEQAMLRWKVASAQPGEYAITLNLSGVFAPPPATAHLRFLPPVHRPRADYVPPPQPVETDIDLCMYYFPGWATDAAWDCIRRIAPVRKPLLGYYDESNPEIVDWQIKWAVENGIRCFLVDWYWVAGSQHLTHWFEAYRQARYRDYLQVAVMWANHNPPGTHSREDWRNVTQEWIDHYFNLRTYYQLNGKPALFLWDPDGLRTDLGGSEEVKAALEESQAMARAAGYAGIEFVAVNRNESPALVKRLLAEGYAGATNYHEYGRALEVSEMRKRARFEELAATIAETWEKRDAISGALTYYPVLETGWDSRPWHASKALVIAGRTPELFERILRDGRAFSEVRNNRMLVVGPANEWGEGSYIEPNTEFGFAMYEAIRRVFAKGDPRDWPVNIGPADVGLGPYAFPEMPPITSWDFTDGPGGWAAMMGVGALRCEEGMLRFRTTTDDPALMASVRGLHAAKHPRAHIRMKLEGTLRPDDHAQLFWSVGGGAITEPTSIRFPLARDGAFHEYTLELAERPRWRGRISMLRFDPCSTRDVEVHVDYIKFAQE